MEDHIQRQKLTDAIRNGVYVIDKSFENESGGIFEPSSYYE